jgi:cytochrome c oxidase subunit 4
MVNETVNYEVEKKGYINVLIGLLVLTVITFALPYMFETSANFLAQMLVAVLKAWLIVIYYMHLKGDVLIGTMAWFTLALVVVFFIIVGIDVAHFQYGAESYITAPSSK